MMTVARLIELLQSANPAAKVCVTYDSGCAYTDIVSVDITSAKWSMEDVVWIEGGVEQDIVIKQEEKIKEQERQRLTAEEQDRENRELVERLVL